MSSFNMTMEDFYLGAKDADYIIYNSTTVGDLKSTQDLISLSPMFEDFKAVKNGNVYMSGNNFYQLSTGTCMMIEDIYSILNDNDGDLTYLTHLE